MDAKYFKTIIARGELHTIGATTLKEYRKYFEKILQCKEDSTYKCKWTKCKWSFTNIKRNKEKLETHHNVTINDSALVLLLLNYQMIYYR